MKKVSGKPSVQKGTSLLVQMSVRFFSVHGDEYNTKSSLVNVPEHLCCTLMTKFFPK